MPVAKPSHQQVRDWMQQRRKEVEPPPSPDRIRELLGWALLKEQHFTGMAIEWDITVTACTA